MADIAGATILSLTRESGSWIRVQYSAGASGYDRIYIWVRTLTGSWRQATTDTALLGSFLVTTIAGAALDANASYQVKLLAHHTSGDPVAESNTVTVDPWEVATPALLGAERTSPTVVRLSYSGATVPDGGKVYVDVRQTPTGTWGQNTAFNPPSAAGQYSINVPSPDASYEVRIYAGQWGVSSDLSSARSVSAWETPIPTISTVTRTSETGATVAYTGAVAGTTLYLQRHIPPTGAWSAQAITPTGTSGSITVTGLSGTATYDLRAYTMQSGSRSEYSGEKSLEAWWSIPAGVLDLAAERRTNGTVDLAWAGTPAFRQPWVGFVVHRAEGELGAFAPLPAGSIGGAARTFYDATAKPERSYRYMVVPYNNAGSATARPVVTSAASVLVPNAPASTTAVWVSDTSADVAWTDPATTERPVTRFIVRRWLLGNWSTVKNDLPGTTLSWRDTGLSKNGVYKYQVQAVNDAGASATYSPESAEVITTPAGASSVTAVRVGGDIRVDWVAPAGTIASSWTVEQTTSATPLTALDGEWYPVSSGTLAGSARQKVHETVSGGTPHTYRVRPTLTGAPVAPWVQSLTVSQYVTPYPPTALPVEPVDAAGPIRLDWVYNSADGTPQWSGEARYRVAGQSTWTRTTIFYDLTSSYTIPAGTLSNGQTIEWFASVESLDAGSADSAVASFTTRARPIVSITEPVLGVPLKSSVLTVTWDTASQSSWTVRLLDANGNVVDVRAGKRSETRTATFDDVKDRGSYSVQVIVRDAFQESLPATVAFTVALDRPAPPLLVATPNPTDGTVSLKVTPVQGLRTTRLNLAPALSDWAAFPSGTITPTSLALLGEDVMALAVTGAYQSVGPSSDTVAVPSGWVAAVGAACSHTTPGLSLAFQLSGETIAAGELLDLPYLRAGSRTSPGSGGSTGPRIEAKTGGALATTGTFYITEPYAMVIRDDATPDVSFFDGDTRRDGHVYGWNPDGTAYEALPTTVDADIAVALTSRIEIIRINVDGTEKSLGDVNEDWQMTDPLPPLGVDFTYIARAWTTAPAYADSNPATVLVVSRDVHVNYGPGWSGHVTGGSRGFGGTGGGRETVAAVYAGHAKATISQAETLDPRSGSVTVQLLPETGVSTLAQWITALGTSGNVTYREPGGLTIEGGAQLGTWDPGSRFKQSVQFTITEGEAV